MGAFKKRLIEDGYFNEECHNCAYSESNLLTEKVCLNLDFIDGDTNNFKIDNFYYLSQILQQ